jgi:4-amino-4-deoxy-L-arabinose transferase-like glycosyltransferase
VLLLILLLGVGLRLYSLASESFWFDETYSVWVARHSVGWQLGQSLQRIFPPLYYTLLHFWLALGDSEFVVRLLSVFIGVSSIVGIYVLVKRLFDARTGLISALLLAISPLHIWYSQEARMYILVAALGIASAYLMLLALREGKPRQWLAYVLSTALAMNAHYFAVFLVPFQNLYVLYLLWPVFRRVPGRTPARPGVWKPWLMSQVVIGLLSVVGLAGVFSTETTYWWGLLDTWHGAPTWRDGVSTLFSFSLGTTVQGRFLYVGGLLLFGFCAAWSLVAAPASAAPTADGARMKAQDGLHWRLSLDDGLVFTLLYLLVPLGAVFAFSQFESFWVLRYIFPFLPAWCIIVARGISRMPGRVLGRLMLASILVASVWPIANAYRYEQKENWRGAVAYISAQERPEDVIVLVDEDIWIPFEHYYCGATRRVGFSRSLTEPSLLAARVGMLVPSYSRIWLVLSHTDNLALKEYLKTSRYTRLESEKLFTQVQVDLFDVNQVTGRE